MRKILLVLIVLVFTLKMYGQSRYDYSDSGSFLLHKFAQNIGKEKYVMTIDGNQVSYDIDFKFVDRGTAVPLQTQLVTDRDHNGISLFIKGSTSRFSTINDTIRVDKNRANIRVDDSVYSLPMPPLAFPVGGYSPGTVQMVLLQFWKKNHEPKSIPLLPFGEVMIKRGGNDTLSYMGKPLLLERYVLGGLIWGNEIIWTDSHGKLICLITNDAEGDKLEMMQEQYESLLPDLISRAANYGMALFSASMNINYTSKQMLAVTGGNIIDIETGQITRDAAIIIENGLIKQIGDASTIPLPANAKVIHAEGKFILPGLWDMHSHFEQAEWGPAYLAAGVTTVRDCGNEFGYVNSIKEAIDSHKGIGPHIVKAGIIDGPGPRGIGIIRASTKEEAVQVVRKYKENGFDQIKVYSSLKPEIVKAICDEAHRLGLTVTGHIPIGMTIQQGVDSGMDQVNHIQYVYSVMKKGKDRSIDLTDSTNAAVLDFLKHHHTVIDPTIGVFEMSFRSVKDNILDMEPAFYTLPQPLQALFKNTGLPEDQAKLYKPVYDGMKGLVKALYDMDIPIVAGTDMGFPGFSVARELELYVESGLTPLQAIQTATIVPARVLHKDGATGSIKVGKEADLVILDADPLLQIRNIRKVWMVIKEGQQYDPHILHKLVGFSE